MDSPRAGRHRECRWEDMHPAQRRPDGAASCRYVASPPPSRSKGDRRPKAAWQARQRHGAALDRLLHRLRRLKHRQETAAPPPPESMVPIPWPLVRLNVRKVKKTSTRALHSSGHADVARKDSEPLPASEAQDELQDVINVQGESREDLAPCGADLQELETPGMIQEVDEIQPEPDGPPAELPELPPEVPAEVPVGVAVEPEAEASPESMEPEAHQLEEPTSVAEPDVQQEALKEELVELTDFEELQTPEEELHDLGECSNMREPAELEAVVSETDSRQAHEVSTQAVEEANNVATDVKEESASPVEVSSGSRPSRGSNALDAVEHSLMARLLGASCASVLRANVVALHRVIGLRDRSAKSDKSGLSGPSPALSVESVGPVLPSADVDAGTTSSRTWLGGGEDEDRATQAAETDIALPPGNLPGSVESTEAVENQSENLMLVRAIVAQAQRRGRQNAEEQTARITGTLEEPVFSQESTEQLAKSTVLALKTKASREAERILKFRGAEYARNLLARALEATRGPKEAKVQEVEPKPMASGRESPNEEPFRCGQWVVAVYGYTAQDEDELSFQVGEKAQVIDEAEDPGWYRVVMQGREGLVPGNFVHALHIDPTRSGDPRVGSPSSGHQARLESGSRQSGSSDRPKATIDLAKPKDIEELETPAKEPEAEPKAEPKLGPLLPGLASQKSEGKDPKIPLSLLFKMAGKLKKGADASRASQAQASSAPKTAEADSGS
mmetsp:Transcript_12450/g.29669  ORF Transcript_12450/g.29669 Transcript_12450/m.29669 type:complete len:733 (+) Transcript_12450:11-2209(+)